MTDAPTGILDPGAIDGVTVDARGRLTLHIVQTCEWDGTDHLLLLVQEKIFTYLAYVADGELARNHPGQHSRWGVARDCVSTPDARTRELLQEAERQFKALGGGFEIRLPPADRG